MSRYGTWEHEQELIALEREDREVFNDEPSGGYYAELAREVANDMANEGQEDYPDEPGEPWVPPARDTDDLDDLPF